MTKYYALLTNLGAAKLANAAALGTKLQITHMSVGDGGGTLPTPNASQTALVAEKRRAALNALSVDAANTSQIIAEQIIPETDGGFWIREVGLFDADGVMIAVANCPETYKPQLQEGSGRTQTVRMILIVNSTDAVTLKIDPAVVLATRKFAEEKAAEARKYADDKVIEIGQYTDGKMASHLAAADPHTQYVKVTDIARYTPVGIPLPYPAANPPAGWLKCNGAAFDKAKYPGLAAVFPSGILPDLRGEFIRGWDDGRGVDAARSLLSGQKGSYLIQESAANVDRVVQFSINDIALLGWDKADANGDVLRARSTGDTSISTWSARPSGNAGVQYLGYSRPRNIALNYIVRAA